MSKIYTKTGDKGTSGLFGGERVKKNHPRLEAYGTLDELNSHVGLIVALLPAQQTQLQTIQKTIQNIASHLALAPLPQLSPDLITDLEKSIDKMTSTLPELHEFILPGGNIISSQIHIARTVCRRAERNIITLAETDTIDPLIIQYINRLSDWLFTLARYVQYNSH
ncbi:MAG: cob(I)yrinic acid a,c-diamide adenosyltransferase [Patescibacteria group bacterium]|jgi:cob(I)alamin adenosyltransferase